MRLLIVEDEWLVAHFIADIAMEQAIEIVGIAQSYKEAVDIINTTTIDCAIVDINLKGSQHGIDVAHHLKTKSIPFLFLTAYKDTDTIGEAASLRPLSYLIKPVSEESLIAALIIAKNIQKVAIVKSYSFTVDEEGMVLKNNKMLSLSNAERIVLSLLIKNHRAVVMRETFFEHLWDHPDDINDGTLRNIISKLRKKFDLQIDNIKNVGYAFVQHN
jgi:DNA-binding response OmpR family regulator